jgi:hypothetical protein
MALVVSCQSKVKQAETPYKSEFSEFIAIKGYDPVEEGVLSSPYLKHRLTKLMGEGKYDTLVRIMYECTPIGFNNDVIYWMGYAKEDPESSGAAILIDLNKDVIYVAYQYHDQIERFSEADDLMEHPTRLQLWLNRRNRVVPEREIIKTDTVALDQ